MKLVDIAVNNLRRKKGRTFFLVSGLAIGIAAAVALTEAVAGTEFSKFIAAPDRRNVARRDLLRSFAVEFGPGSDRALQLVCRKDDGVSVLSEIRLRLRVEAVEAPLSATSLDTAKAGKGNCPARFWVEGTE